MSGLFGEDIDRSGHKSVEWYTPRWIFDALGLRFDTDPASPHDHETHVPAGVKYTVHDDGLKQQWHGRVWINPPYGPTTGRWMDRFIEHGHGIAMTFSRTDATWCQRAMAAADAILFMRGRVDFEPGHENKHKRSRAGAGTVLFAMGQDCADALDNLAGEGVLLRLVPRAAPYARPSRPRQKLTEAAGAGKCLF